MVSLRSLRTARACPQSPSIAAFDRWHGNKSTFQKRKRMTAKSEIAAASSSNVKGASAGIAATGMTSIVVVAELFATFVSGLEVVTDAVFDIAPAVAGSVRTREIVAPPAEAIVPSVQVTIAVPLQVP